jgi:hypothetical protein
MATIWFAQELHVGSLHQFALYLWQDSVTSCATLPRSFS